MAKPSPIISFPLVAGLNSFTVPSDATYWCLGISWWTASPNTLNAPTITFGTVASGATTTSAGTAGGPFDQFIGRSHGPVTSTGAGKQITIAFSNASADEGPSGFIHFFKGQHATTPVLDAAFARSTEANVAGTATVNTNADCICIAIDAGYREFNMPTSVSGWVFDQAQDNNNSNRAAIYNRVAPGTPTQSFTGVPQYYRSVILFSLQGVSGGGGDTDPPVLSVLSAAILSASTASGGATTTEGGPAWAMISTLGSAPNAATIKAGTGATATATATLTAGANPGAFAFSGATFLEATNYYMDVVQDDTASPVNTSLPQRFGPFTYTPPPDAPRIISDVVLDIELGSSATPGAQAIVGGVPPGALGVVVIVEAIHGTTPFDGQLTGLTSNFTGAFTILPASVQIAVAAGQSIAYAKVTSTGGSKTITPVFNKANNYLPGVNMSVMFIENINPDDFYLDHVIGQASVDGYTPGTGTLETEVASLVIVKDVRLSMNTVDYPPVHPGCTNLQTAIVGSGTNGYSMARVQKVTTPTNNSAFSVTTQNTQASTIAAISLVKKPLTPDTEAPVMVGSITVGQKTNSTIPVSCPDATDNVGVTGYEFSRDGGSTYPYTSSTPNYTFTGLTDETSYDIRVRARDAAGNRAIPLSVTESTYPDGATGQWILDNTGPIGGGYPGIMFNDGIAGADLTRWHWFEIVTPPASGAFTELYADGRFEFEGPSNTFFTYNLYVNNVLQAGSPAMVTLYATVAAKRRILLLM